MASILDVAILFGKETTYGTPVTLTDAFEGKADTYKRVQEYIDSVGFRAGMETLRSDRTVDINMGGEGTLEIDVLTTGFGFLLQAMLGSVAGPTQQGATSAYLTTATSTAADPDDFFTVQIQRVDVGGTQRDFTHHGGVITGWTIAQEVGGLLGVTFDMDFEDVDTSTGAGTPTYAASNVPFDWTMAKATLDSVDTDIVSMELTADLGLKTDRRFLRQSGLKKQPIRSGMPSFEGTITLELNDLTEYADFVAGTVIPIIFTWTGAEIESPHNSEVIVTCNACQYRGGEPVVSLQGDTPMITLPFKVLDNGTDAAMTITYMSTDTSL
jgi:hypothetical protein